MLHKAMTEEEVRKRAIESGIEEKEQIDYIVEKIKMYNEHMDQLTNALNGSDACMQETSTKQKK